MLDMPIPVESRRHGYREGDAWMMPD